MPPSKTPPQPADTLTLAEACQALGLRYHEGWAAVMEGRIPATKRGMQWAISRPAVEALRQAQEEYEVKLAQLGPAPLDQLKVKKVKSA